MLVITSGGLGKMGVEWYSTQLMCSQTDWHPRLWNHWTLSVLYSGPIVLNNNVLSVIQLLLLLIIIISSSNSSSSSSSSSSSNILVHVIEIWTTAN